MNDKKDRFNVMNLIKQGEEFDQEMASKNNQPYVSPETMLLLSRIELLQSSLNTLLSQVAGFRYAIEKTNPDLIEKVNIGTLINEYVNINLIVKAYKRSPQIDLSQLKQLNERITAIELELSQKGNEYLEDAKRIYEEYITKSKSA